ncbi:hypothetical protein [Halioxenophilus aromaticivorans]|uniref:Uncharacterized protein n=1 Tax=Halioxenophilus aromaticivorans TaxID=1306992 RepID=A0AAV3U5W2_9ALTE
MSETPKTPLNDSELDAKLATLSARIEPENELWPQIAAQIHVPARPWWQAGSAVAASLLVGVLGITAALFTGLQNQHLRGEIAANFDVRQQNTAMMPASYTAANAATTPLIDQCLQPSQAQVIEQNLGIIQSAINEINSALEQAPNNPALNKRLLDLSKQQVNLINRANAISL